MKIKGNSTYLKMKTWIVLIPIAGLSSTAYDNAVALGAESFSITAGKAWGNTNSE
jgi:hypothetical protein